MTRPQGLQIGLRWLRSPWLRMIACAAILGALVARLGSAAVLDGLAAIDAGQVLAALGIGLVTTVLSAWRWCLVARGLGLRLRLGVAVADCYRAVFLNSVLPAGVLGDVHRAVSHGRGTGERGRGFRAVVLERVAGQGVVFAVGVAMLLAQPTLLTAVFGALAFGGPGPERAIAVGAVAAVVAVAFGVWCVRSGRASRIRGVLRTVVADIGAGVLSRRTWPGVVLLSVAALVGYLALFVVAARAAGAQAPIGELVPLLVPALLVMAVPFNVGGWGPREAVTAVGFGAAGFGATQGLTTAVVYGVLSLIACLPGVGVLVLRRPISRLRGRAAVGWQGC